MKRTLADFAKACDGRLHGADRSFAGVSSDSRTLAAGDLFVALRGPRFDGHDFIPAALAAGAAGALVSRPQSEPIAQIRVNDTLAGLDRAARAWRSQFDIPVVGVAGSNGKTTAKEMTAAILGELGPCLATRGNLNNHIGVPLTLLRLESQHRAAVIEMGANQAGDVAALVETARPGVGLITNAGAEHLEGFGSLEGAARAEGEMVAGLASGATAVINADDEFADLWRDLTSARVVTFGLQNEADFTASDIRTSVAEAGFLTRFTLSSPIGSAEIPLQMGGHHNVANALAAAAAAVSAGARLQDVVGGLRAARAVPGRLQLKRTASGAWLIDDSYNANPSSVRAGIEVLSGIEGRKWLVLGEMAELGAFSAEAHTEMGRLARERGIEKLFGLGGATELAVASFGSGAQWFADVGSLAAALRTATPDVRMLIKGSRMNRLERVVDALVGLPSGAGGRH